MPLIFLFFPFSLLAQETTVMVRVHSKDAKFIGSSIGGAKVLVRNEATGELLAEGITRGSTGDTEKIMQEPRKRGERLSTGETAGFLARLDITEPVFVTIEAIAPVNKRQAAVRSSTQLWVIPGKNIEGDGVVLEVPGFVIDILSPQTHERIAQGEDINIRANVVMMCGCPVTPGGIWNADDYEVTAIIKQEGGEPREVRLEPIQKPSTFEEKISLEPGNYEITVYAFDPQTGNTGLDRTNIIVQ
ncbi:hypothetical protein FHG64_16655 [Antarcticibacterium flavum]|uniref:Uncharacterized protein n=2 Tax=Flavobacteriaceae TaxID=49546 RepID=A0A5B7XA06_9FLAO|nr:hypothetical protein [Antarcticibacterium sp. W02-3]QCY71473.1 hypothetical protein FHG64_16655 [Antarcticibacterium flavum]